MELSAELSTLSILILGFFLVLRHATEADHLAAVSTIVSEKRSLRDASIIGGLWGVGHTLSLFIVGLAVIGLKISVSPTIENVLEGIVGIMLVLLGANALRKLRSADAVHIHTHEHGGRVHTHLHSHFENAPEPSHHRFSRRSVIVGMVHGLAGSAALMLLIVPTIDSAVVALGYILAFGLGSIGGMMLMSFFVGLPFYYAAGRRAILDRGLRVVAGLFSLVLGCAIVYEHLIAGTIS